MYYNKIWSCLWFKIIFFQHRERGQKLTEKTTIWVLFFSLCLCVKKGKILEMSTVWWWHSKKAKPQLKYFNVWQTKGWTSKFKVDTHSLEQHSPHFEGTMCVIDDAPYDLKQHKSLSSIWNHKYISYFLLCIVLILQQTGFPQLFGKFQTHFQQIFKKKFQTYMSFSDFKK